MKVEIDEDLLYNAEEEKETFWEKFFATRKTDKTGTGITAIHEKILKERMREVMELMPNMTHEEYVKLINFRYSLAKANKTDLVNVYEEILDLTRWISEADFQELRKKVLEQKD